MKIAGLIHKFNNAVYKSFERFNFFKIAYAAYKAHGVWRKNLLEFLFEHRGQGLNIIAANDKAVEILSQEYCFKIPVSAYGFMAVRNEYDVKRRLSMEDILSSYYDECLLLGTGDKAYLKARCLYKADTAAKDAFVPVWAKLLTEQSREIVISEAMLKERFPYYSEILKKYKAGSKMPEEVYALDGLRVRQGFCHGDLHEDNIMYNDAAGLTLIDFEDASFDGFVEMEVFQYVMYRLRTNNPKTRMEVVSDVFFGEEYTLTEVARFGDLFRKDLLFLYALIWESRDMNRLSCKR